VYIAGEEGLKDNPTFLRAMFSIQFLKLLMILVRLGTLSLIPAFDIFVPAPLFLT